MKRDSSVTEEKPGAAFLRGASRRPRPDGDLGMTDAGLAFPRRYCQSGASMPNRRARVLHTKTLYEGSVFSVRQDRIAEPGGIVVTRDIVENRESGVLLAYFTY